MSGSGQSPDLPHSKYYVRYSRSTEMDPECQETGVQIMALVIHF